jgi:ribosomal protein L11 methyltransferase
MAYRALSFDAAATDAERWADALLGAGALAVDTSDANAGTPDETARFGEPGTEASLGAVVASWPVTRLTALFEADADIEGALARLGVELGSAPPPHTIDAVPETDWVRNSQVQFAPLQVSERLWIVPSWCEPVAASAINLRIDPGLAFGTGTHATTRLCMRWLDAHLAHGAYVLDYGCGSGILAITAAKLGADGICGVDVDPQAVLASRANAVANAVNVWFGSPDALPDGAFDVVIANILANPLELLAPLLAGRVRANGKIVLSGILDAQAAHVVAAYTRWFNIDIWEREEGWVALAGSRMDDRG